MTDGREEAGTRGREDELAALASQVVAGFTSTRSKVPEAMFGGPGGPSHMVRAHGCRVDTADGRSLIDWTMALGAVSLGYGHPHVTEAVVRAVRDGVVGPLSPVLEARVAERLCAVYPGADQARFFKTGAEAVQAAVRIARAATGRQHVVHCGYHGWLDGPTAGAGVPKQVSDLWTAVPYDNLDALRSALSLQPSAALVLEPFIEREPSREWLTGAQDLARDAGSVLILDEIKTAFRLSRGGAAEAWGLTPDLAVLGKAMANGFPLAAVVGRGDLMARVRSTWISSTLATEFVSLAAADAVLDVWERDDVAGYIAGIGRRMLAGLAGSHDRHEPAPFRMEGIASMFLLRFDTPATERRFLLGCSDRGLLLKRGAYNFPSLAHREVDVARSVAIVRETLGETA